MVDGRTEAGMLGRRTNKGQQWADEQTGANSGWTIPRVVELEVELQHGCPSGDHRSPGVVKLVMGFHHGSPRVNFTKDVSLGSKR